MAQSSHLVKGHLSALAKRNEQKAHPYRMNLPSHPIPLRSSAHPVDAHMLHIKHRRIATSPLLENDISLISTAPQPVVHSIAPQSIVQRHGMGRQAGQAGLSGLSGIEGNLVNPVTPPVAMPYAVAGSVPAMGVTGEVTDRGVNGIANGRDAIAERGSGVSATYMQGAVHRVALREEYVAVRHRFRPLDDVRWWLVRPGRIEFLLWLIATLLLLVITAMCMFGLALHIERAAASGPLPPVQHSNALPSPLPSR